MKPFFSRAAEFFRRSRSYAGRASSIRVTRLDANPIIRPAMLPGNDGGNICGPSLILAPTWLKRRLGRYYLYFAHHGGTYIRLAFADSLEGPWSVYEPGTLQLAQVPSCRSHIASPDLHIDHERGEIRMYFHGPSANSRGQNTFVALSDDGIDFRPSEEALGTSYFRAVQWNGRWLAMARGGRLYDSADGLRDFVEMHPPAFGRRDALVRKRRGVRHVALRRTGSVLSVFYTRVGTAPESILHSRIDLGAWPNLTAHSPELVLWPETTWEGADLPLRRSTVGPARGRENALRDPAIFEEGERVFMVYSVAGEAGLAIAELRESRPGSG